MGRDDGEVEDGDVEVDDDDGVEVDDDDVEVDDDEEEARKWQLTPSVALQALSAAAQC